MIRVKQIKTISIKDIIGEVEKYTNTDRGKLRGKWIYQDSGFYCKSAEIILTTEDSQESDVNKWSWVLIKSDQEFVKFANF